MAVGGLRREPLAGCGTEVRQGGGAPVLRQLRRAVDPEGKLGKADRLPQYAARRSHRHGRSEEHTSELQSRLHLVCRLLLEKKKKKKKKHKSEIKFNIHTNEGTTS